MFTRLRSVHSFRAPGRSVPWIVTLTAAAAIGVLPGGLNAQETKPPSAEEVLDRYVEVTGGADAYRKLTNEKITATIEVVESGQKGRFESFRKAPDIMVRKESMGETGETIRGTNGTIAWELSPIFGARLLEGIEKAQFAREAMFNGALYWRKQYRDVEWTGVEEVEGEPCDMVVLTPEVGGAVTSWYETGSGLLRKTAMTIETAVGPMDLEVALRDYRETHGIKTPRTVVITLMGAEIRSKVESDEYNIEVPEGTFDVPEKVQALLDDPR